MSELTNRYTPTEDNKETAALAATLAPQFPDGFCMVMSIANRERNSTAGRAVEVTVKQAAKLIVEKTHRLATPDEIEVFRSAR